MTTTNNLTRREFIKWSSVVSAWTLLPHGLRELDDHEAAPPTSLGRIASGYRQPVRKEAALKAEIVSYKSYDDIIPLFAQVEGEAPWPSNPIWYQTDEGYIHSAYVQPVENTPSGGVVTSIDKPGIWLQVCVPIAGSRWRPDSKVVSRKLYYGTVYHGVAALQDDQGEWWYQLQEGIAYSPGPYVPAWSMHHLSDGEMSPIAPGRDDKRIEVDIARQLVTCFEGDTPVFSTRCASGLPGTVTPQGKHDVIRKRYTSYMIGGEGAGYYNLPGVAFPTYFTASGVAIHGTYWHNDFGRPKSHGCVNVSNDAAKRVFRWTMPNVPYDTYNLNVKRGDGTKITVV
jgi:hypothetical protein